MQQEDAAGIATRNCHNPEIACMQHLDCDQVWDTANNSREYNAS
jgi:hypothetical protein